MPRSIPEDTPEDAPVERFHPTSGRLIGIVSLVAAVALVVLTAVSEPNLTGVRICLVLALVALLIWVLLLRPRAAAYVETLVLYNHVSDWLLPVAGINEVVVRHATNVWVDGKRYTCSGIGRPSRQMVRGPSGQPSSLFARRDERTGAGDAAGIGSVNYATFVENRILELAHEARREGVGAPPVRRRWAVPELAAFTVLGLATLVAFLV